MGYRKIYVAVWCDSEQEKAQVQRIAEELSEIAQLRAKDVISTFPTIKKNQDIITTVVREVSTKGPKGVIGLLPLVSKIKM